MTMLLAADIGATKTVLALFTPENGPRHPIIERELATADYLHVDDLVQTFLREVHGPIDGAVLGIAAPVKGGRATMINLPWVASEGHLKDLLKIDQVRLLNDLEAVTHAIPLLNSEDIHTLHRGDPEADGAIAVIAPGTGLGEAFLLRDGERYLCYPSEGGHADFAPVGLVELELLRHLGEKYDHVSWERVCSGPGLFNIYTFLKNNGLAIEPLWLTQQLADSKDPLPIIVKAGIDPIAGCRICEMTLDIFMSILGAEAGNLALKILATGGIYLAGGIPPRIVDALKKGPFLKRLQGKGRESFVVSDFPVHVILNTRAALIGAAAYGLKHFAL